MATKIPVPRSEDRYWQVRLTKRLTEDDCTCLGEKRDHVALFLEKTEKDILFFRVEDPMNHMFDDPHTELGAIRLSETQSSPWVLIPKALFEFIE